MSLRYSTDAKRYLYNWLDGDEMLACSFTEHASERMLGSITIFFACEWNFSSPEQFVGCADQQAIVDFSALPALHCIRDVELHETRGAKWKDCDSAALGSCLSITSIHTQIFSVPWPSVSLSFIVRSSPTKASCQCTGGLSFIPGCFHQVDLQIAGNERHFGDGWLPGNSGYIGQFSPDKYWEGLQMLSASVR